MLIMIIRAHIPSYIVRVSYVMTSSTMSSNVERYGDHQNGRNWALRCWNIVNVGSPELTEFIGHFWPIGNRSGRAIPHEKWVIYGNHTSVLSSSVKTLEYRPNKYGDLKLETNPCPITLNHYFISFHLVVNLCNRPNPWQISFSMHHKITIYILSLHIFIFVKNAVFGECGLEWWFNIINYGICKAFSFNLVLTLEFLINYSQASQLNLLYCYKACVEI